MFTQERLSPFIQVYIIIGSHLSAAKEPNTKLLALRIILQGTSLLSTGRGGGGGGGSNGFNGFIKIIKLGLRATSRLKSLTFLFWYESRI